MTLAHSLWHANEDLSQACLKHPFVEGIANGAGVMSTPYESDRPIVLARTDIARINGAPVNVPVSCIRFAGVVACAAECSESCDTSVDMGYFCRFYAEYTRLHCKRIFNTDDL